MAPVEWSQVVEVFNAAREKSGRERVLLLDTVCGDRTLLRKAVEGLLKEHESAVGFLSEPLFSSLTGEPLPSRIVPGQQFEQYVAVALLGRGGMGEVWRARDTQLDRPVALKFLCPENNFGFEAEQITREAKAVSALNHPNIVTVHEVVHSESNLAIVMEFVEGSSLGQARGKQIPTAEVVAIGLQIARGLAAAHACGIIHGDIKPENILLRQDGYIKLLDFGLACSVTTERLGSATSPALGTLRYMSPEQARGESLTPASDIFSFGLLLYELATGRHAFPAPSPLDTAHDILTKAPAPLSAVNPLIPAALNSLILAMLAKDPAARPSAQQVSQRLDECQAAETSSEGSVPKFKRWVIAAGLVVAACFGMWLKHSKQTVDQANRPLFRQITTLVPENRATSAAVSPDGKWTAYANIDGIFLRSTTGAGTRALLTPSDLIVDQIAWFVDGGRLAVSGFSPSTYVPSVWIVSRGGGPPRLLRDSARQGIPSPNGAQIAFTSRDQSDIWIIGTDGTAPRSIVAGGADDTFPVILWSPNGKRLAFQRRHYLPAHLSETAQRELTFDPYYDRSYESVDIRSGHVTAVMPNMWISSAAMIPDGRILFLRWYPAGSASADQLWEVKTESATGAFSSAPRLITALNEPRSDTDHIYELTATSDGRQVTVLRKLEQNAIFVGDFDSENPHISNIRRLTLDERNNYPHAWTLDSRAVIFESNRNGSYGNYDIFKQEAGRHTPEAIIATPELKFMPQLTPDGRWILYARRIGTQFQKDKLMRVPLEGGSPEEVPIGGSLDEFRCTHDIARGCVLRSSVGHEYSVFYELDAVRGKGRELTRTQWTPRVLGDWDVSSDGATVAIPDHTERGARIRLVSLRPSSLERAVRDVPLPGLSNLNGVIWAPNNKGWLITIKTSIGTQLLYCYLDGSFRSLGDVQGWALPSPDGHRVAFVNDIVGTNAWLIDLH